MELSKVQKRKMVNNLQRTLLLIELHQELKLSLYRALQPHKNETELLRLLNQERLRRKNWNENLLKSGIPVDWLYLEKQMHKLKLNKAFIRQFRNKGCNP